MSSRKISASLSIGGTAVVDCLQRARAVGIGWPLPEDLSDVVPPEARLFPASMAVAASADLEAGCGGTRPTLARCGEFTTNNDVNSFRAARRALLFECRRQSGLRTRRMLGTGAGAEVRRPLRHRNRRRPPSGFDLIEPGR
jgi:hypothetical protein